MAKYNADQTDKIYDLERENTSLKLKENLLESEIVKMRTKLRRIDELMKKKRSTSAGAQTALPAEVHRQLEDEINKIGGENDAMKQRNKKLRAIEKELSVKQVTKKAPINKFSHVKGKL
jgi:predicted  nucleic acid-binding Zn-ribbon protein